MRLLLLLVILAALAGLLLVVRFVVADALGRRKRVPDRPGRAKGFLLVFLTLPVLMAAIVSMARGLLLPMLANGAAYGLLAGGSWLLWRGLVSESEHARRLVAKTPPPLKGLGAALIGLGTGLTAWLGVGHHPAVAVAFGLVAMVGCRLFYGADPTTTKRVTSAAGVDTTDRVLSALARAEGSIAAIEQASLEIRQPELHDRLHRIAGLAREILALLEEDPRDLPRAGKFLNVYLDGAQRVVEGYARTHRRATSPDLDANFRRVLTTIEDVFRDQQRRLLESDILDLDVQIEVLANQLKREGLL